MENTTLALAFELCQDDVKERETSRLGQKNKNSINSRYLFLAFSLARFPSLSLSLSQVALAESLFVLCFFIAMLKQLSIGIEHQTEIKASKQAERQRRRRR